MGDGGAPGSLAMKAPCSRPGTPPSGQSAAELGLGRGTPHPALRLPAISLRGARAPCAAREWTLWAAYVLCGPGLLHPLSWPLPSSLQ